jgi:hypothetical protein
MKKEYDKPVVFDEDYWVDHYFFRSGEESFYLGSFRGDDNSNNFTFKMYKEMIMELIRRVVLNETA